MNTKPSIQYIIGKINDIKIENNTRNITKISSNYGDINTLCISFSDTNIVGDEAKFYRRYNFKLFEVFKEIFNEENIKRLAVDDLVTGLDVATVLVAEAISFRAESADVAHRQAGSRKNNHIQRRCLPNKDLLRIHADPGKQRLLKFGLRPRLAHRQLDWRGLVILVAAAQSQRGNRKLTGPCRRNLIDEVHRLANLTVHHGKILTQRGTRKI